MLRIRTIDSLELPELAPYRTMQLHAEHYQERLFVVEGPKVLRRLLTSELGVVSVLIPPDHLEPLRPFIEARPEHVDVFLAPKPVLERLTGFSMYQGFLACARIPEPMELDVALSRATRPRFLVALDGLANAENLGGVVRSAAAFGAHALLVGESCAHPYLRRAVRASMGSIFGLPAIEPISLRDALVEVRKRGVRCVAAHPGADRRLLPDVAFGGDCCIVLGNEGAGLSADVLEACDDLVAVPMQHGVNSLNVSAAAAVFFYELWRQRREPSPARD